jgi:hypothetical protein
MRTQYKYGTTACDHLRNYFLSICMMDSIFSNLLVNDLQKLQIQNGGFRPFFSP